MKKLETQLADCVLRFDGVVTVSPDTVARCLLLGVEPSSLRVTELTEEVEQFNLHARDAEIQVVGSEPVNLSFRWQLPLEYQTFDLWDRIAGAYISRADELSYTPAQEDQALGRMEVEYNEIQKRGMVEFIRTVIYVIDRFREGGVIWGVGRGSSCASYILFLLGLHVVDCVLLDVPYTEFFHN